jgi:RNA polymerase sigma-70 factor (ECF subfamily)
MLDFPDIYDEQLQRVYGFIAYRVANRADAEDLTQQTFERALRHWADFDPRRASVSTWLLAIARNLVIDHHRLRAQRTRTVDLDEAPASDLPSGDLDAALGVSPELSTALAALNDRERELVALRFGADCTGQQIADLVGLSLANVQQTLSRSLRKLRASLEQSSPRGAHIRTTPVSEITARHE